MRFPLLLLLFAVSPLLNGQTSEREILEPFRWKYRLIAYSLHPDDEERFFATLAEYSDESSEREIRFISLSQGRNRGRSQHLQLDTGDIEHLRKALRAKPEETVLILIGKDGTIKNRISTIDLPKLFSQIDQMPMRRSEIRANQ